MNKMALKNILVSTAILTLIAVGAFYIAYTTLVVDADNPGSLPALTSTSSNITLGTITPGATLFEPSQGCSARIVSTHSEEVLLTFEADRDPSVNDVASTTLAPNTGLVQAASTTVVYAAENFGCGWVTGITDSTPAASTTLSVVESF